MGHSTRCCPSTTSSGASGDPVDERAAACALTPTLLACCSKKARASFSEDEGEPGPQDLRLLPEERRPRITGAETRVREDGTQLGQIRRQPGEVKLGERGERSADRGDKG